MTLSRRTAVVAIVWGILQFVFSVRWLLTRESVRLDQSNPAFLYTSTVDALFSGLILIIALFAGYALKDAYFTFQALLLSQTLSWLLTIMGIGSGYPTPFYIPFIIIWFFLQTLAASLFGTYLREWMDALSYLSLDWRLPATGLFLNGVALLLPISAAENTPLDSSGVSYYQYQWLLAEYTIPSISLLITASIAISLYGLKRKKLLRPELGGLLVLTTLILVGIAIVSIGFTNAAHELCIRLGQISAQRNCSQTGELLTILWLAGLSLLTPAAILLRFIRPRYLKPTNDNNRNAKHTRTGLVADSGIISGN